MKNHGEVTHEIVEVIKPLRNHSKFSLTEVFRVACIVFRNPTCLILFCRVLMLFITWQTLILYVDGSKNEKVKRSWLVMFNLGYVLYFPSCFQFLEIPFLWALKNLLWLSTPLCALKLVSRLLTNLRTDCFSSSNSARYISEHRTNSELLILFTPVILQGDRPPLSWQK